MPRPDLTPPARQLADLVRGVSDEQLRDPTPCPDYTVGDLVEHIGGLSVAFTAAATKDLGGDAAAPGPSGDAARLEPDWRDRIPRAVVAMGEAWRDSEAWTGMTAAGGVDLPGEVAGLVALDELVVHGWDLARATGQPFEVDGPALEGVLAFVEQFSGPGQEEARGGLFGPEIVLPGSAPLLDRVLGMTGRDPVWTPA
jgi:uncharacterized protein (TIGR03086 family)